MLHEEGRRTVAEEESGGANSVKCDEEVVDASPADGNFRDEGVRDDGSKAAR